MTAWRRRSMAEFAAGKSTRQQLTGQQYFLPRGYCGGSRGAGGGGRGPHISDKIYERLTARRVFDSRVVVESPAQGAPVTRLA